MDSWVISPVDQEPVLPANKKIVYLNRRVTRSDGNFKLLKFGNGSGDIVQGRIKDVDIGVVVIRGVAYLRNFTVVPENSNGKFATPGDSGSLLVLEKNINGEDVLVAVGILFAALQNTPSIGLACNISEVINALDLGTALGSLLVNF